MENPIIINLMRIMNVDCRIDLETLHISHPKCTKLYRGRPEMLLMTMRNGRNVQMFRGGKVQILGCIPNDVAESMRNEVIMRLRKVYSMQLSQVTKMTITNMVVSARLRRKICLRKIATSDVNLFHEIELFPAALIRKWHPVHIALFHNGKVILTGLKSVEQFYEIMSTLTSFLESCNIYE